MDSDSVRTFFNPLAGHPTGPPPPKTPETPPPETPESVKGSFEYFFAKREEAKKSLYLSVVYWSILTSLVCGFVLVGGLIIVGNGFYLFGGLVSFLGGLGFSLGICIASTVPVSEFDIEEQLRQNSTLRVLLSLICGLVTAAFGAAACCFFPYFPSVPLLLSGLWCASHELKLDTKPLVLKIVSFLISYTLTFAHAYLSLAWSPERILTNVTGYLVEVAQYSIAHRGVYSLLASVYAALLLLGLGLLFEYIRRLDKTTKGWTTTVLYATLYMTVSFLFGLGSLFIGTVIPVLTETALYSTLWVYIGNTIVALLPVLLVLAIGKAKTFTLLARYFEYNVQQLQEDGAQMAYLVSKVSSSTLLVNGTYWVKRVTEDAALKPSDKGALASNAVKRWIWAKGTVVDPPAAAQQPGAPPAAAATASSAQMFVHVRLQDDYYVNWPASRQPSTRLEGAQEQTNRCCCEKAEKEACSVCWRTLHKSEDRFLAWKAATFDPALSSVFDAKEQTVTLCIKLSSKVQRSKMDMKKWATDSDNFRAFEWDMRMPDLFSRSPRELSSKVERDSLFALSRPRSIVTNADKLDFFVSHSWEDDGNNKYNRVKTFMEKERAAQGDYPTLWLDKVCINQNDTSSAISVLPIIIGGCRRVLVLLSPTYLSRLWCVWELFSLFTFCNNELALERITVIALEAFDASLYLPSEPGSIGSVSVSDIDTATKKVSELVRRLNGLKDAAQRCFSSSQPYVTEETVKSAVELLGEARKELISILDNKIKELQGTIKELQKKDLQKSMQAHIAEAELDVLQLKMDNVILDHVLDNFELSNAHCFDPNEEAKLMQVFGMITRVKRSGSGESSVSIKEIFALLKGKFKEAIRQFRQSERDRKKSVSEQEEKDASVIAERDLWLKVEK